MFISSMLAVLKNKHTVGKLDFRDLAVHVGHFYNQHGTQKEEDEDWLVPFFESVECLRDFEENVEGTSLIAPTAQHTHLHGLSESVTDSSKWEQH